MGLVYADIQLANGDDLALVRRGFLRVGEVRRVHIEALVDSGAYMLSINEAVKAQLGLETLDTTAAELADGTRVQLDVVGPIEVRFENRRTQVEALVLPGEQEMLLGAIPMEAMDVVIDPRQRRLIVNPAHPNIAETKLK
jgi:clan AA aspartic protease